MADVEECHTGLCLGLGLGGYAGTKDERQPKDNNNNNNNKKKNVRASCIDLSFTLCPNDEDAGDIDHDEFMAGNFGHKSYQSNDYKKINISSRKKLRLTKEQSSLLEDSFKLHTTLNSSQKQALAERLNLKPRQVEVWFQNRRARTKLKQTEVDCEFLKRCCESLTGENKRLKKELQELQSIKAGASPLFIQLQKATSCSSCQKIMRTTT